jgi:DNA-binding MarR family transcriptional regulator
MDDDIQQSADRFIELITRLQQLAPEKPPPQAAGLSPSLMAIIDYVARSPNCGVKEIARGLNLSTPTVSVSVRHLEEAGFIGRRTHPTDRRAVQIFLTPRGQALYHQTYTFRRQKFEKLLAGLTPAERETLISLMAKAVNQAELDTKPISHKKENPTS